MHTHINDAFDSVTDAPNSPSIYTIHNLAASIRPDWATTADWTLKQNWMCWPPDMFALLAIILERTGCYKICLLDYDWWQLPTWESDVQAAAEFWICNTTDLLSNGQSNGFLAQPSKMPVLLRESLSVLEEIDENRNRVSIDDLRVLTHEQQVSSSDGIPEDIKRRRSIAKAIVTLYAIADNACVGFGLPEKYESKQAPAAKFMHALANLLLTATGSLSTLPKFHGIVLPKMRTPQAGQMLRSLSHHLTFHTTEVEVVWRTIPWSNHHQKTINIVAVPFPFEVKETNFQVRSERFHTVQYFSYVSTAKIDNEKTVLYIERIVELVWEQCCQLDQIHILVLPEAALSEEQYQQLLNSLKRRFEQDQQDNDKAKQERLYQLPLIVAGVYKDDLTSDPTSYEGVEKSIGHNEVRVATFFAGRWYDIAQRKHHRWQLDRHQIIQYQLEGKFPTERKWFEHISVSQRRLTILAPTGWLTLTSLICEDLARLEPVSELIRGIGPTLLMALLSDGPQKNHRWSARYASVLADDPGTAVLTLTSLGMATRSKKLNSDPTHEEKSRQYNDQVRHTVGLWKDLIMGYRLLEIDEKVGEINNLSMEPESLLSNKSSDANIMHLRDNRKRALRITVSASYQEEFTLDGRSDHNNAAVFRLDGFEALELPISEKIIKQAKSKTTDSKETFKQGKWNDIRELSALLFTLDSLMELKVASVLSYKSSKVEGKLYSNEDFNKHLNHILSWFIIQDIQTDNYDKSLQLVINTLKSALKYPSRHGIDAQENEPWPSDEIKRAGDRIRELFNQLESKQISQTVELYYELVIISYELLIKAPKLSSVKQQEERVKERIDYLIPMLVIYTLYAKLSSTPIAKADAPNEQSIPAIVRLRKNIREVLLANQSTLIWGNASKISLDQLSAQIILLKELKDQLHVGKL